MNINLYDLYYTKNKDDKGIVNDKSEDTEIE